MYTSRMFSITLTTTRVLVGFVKNRRELSRHPIRENESFSSKHELCLAEDRSERRAAVCDSPRVRAIFSLRASRAGLFGNRYPHFVSSRRYVSPANERASKRARARCSFWSYPLRRNERTRITLVVGGKRSREECYPPRGSRTVLPGRFM